MLQQILEFSTNHPFLVVAFLALSGLILFTEFRNLSQKFITLGPSAAISIINKSNTMLLDVREVSEIKAGMLNDAIHIPLSGIGKRLAELDKYKDDSVLVYCRSGSRSGSVCRTLSGRGFEKVYNLAGGIMAWEDAHLPVSTKRKK
ncbi:MAG: rhodanese-like domain-containing protein [Gammaproteobacteria bacterium]|jgi:rhodanese-related sulfurtransferase|nr:rhodanese-like domain-containing protein [Gammaproteobacteria bacterium]MBT4078317.1 rhodanese-like domain-containing protein [Gammaproteobacteria bacterium]MBT4194248.1 rhodanese-like domain-containing protein [Gammaproteobacteria bacterium]MBT4451618.1 rhodanese-like domain-containing protein [Gammaproteobacteria bacterium]MBT4861930.1 rhodanese-like domain-containing protein [Gammaproteobacteria bacterium]